MFDYCDVCRFMHHDERRKLKAQVLPHIPHPCFPIARACYVLIVTLIELLE
ncbi:hypothetical protein Lsan_3648 [Legionella santicrucis]|uniref:Uncharacterized protein n=1 Tax=Legionella santicrucis TaxID=45074 RepID=A0A0W0Y9E9_9GAMM|nr:hypothetical protein [Legionella santicrucis]KTD53238.1 hypothetical protein Lsan_3648 [Legionella santicrucis]